MKQKKNVMVPPSRKESSSLNVSLSVPRHVGIIMDRNGRWAQARGLPRTAGHRVGIENVRRIVDTALELKIGVLTFYTFSTENWQRPREEVDFLMSYCEDFVHREMDELHAHLLAPIAAWRRQWNQVKTEE